MPVRRPLPNALVALLLCLLALPESAAQMAFEEEAILAAEDAGAPAEFGLSVALDGDRAVVGANRAACDSGDSNCGAAYVFERDGDVWTETARLLPSDGAAFWYFGFAVALDGDRAVVTADGATCDGGADCGAAYVFDYDGNAWTETAKLVSSNPRSGIRFGNDVAVDGDRVVVGAFRDDCEPGDNAGCGAAYVFEPDGEGAWAESARLTASDGGTTDWFGFSIALDGDRLLVGAQRDRCDGGDGTCGSAYVFDYDGTWEETARITASDGAPFDLFGFAADLDGDHALVGARGDDCTAGPACGAAYVFELEDGVWTETTKLTPDERENEQLFGAAVALDGDGVLVGAEGEDCAGGGLNCGAAYVFGTDSTGWAQADRLVASDAASFDNFGVAVDLSGSYALVGAYLVDCAAGFDCGAAYVFERAGGTSVGAPAAAAGLALGPVFPNPARGTAAASVSAAAGQPVSATVYDVLGRPVATLHDGPLSGGRLTVPAAGLTPGLYVLRVRSGETVVSRRFAVVR